MTFKLTWNVNYNPELDLICFHRGEPPCARQLRELIRLEQDIFTMLAAQKQLYVYKTQHFWSQIKSAGYAH